MTDRLEQIKRSVIENLTYSGQQRLNDVQYLLNLITKKDGQIAALLAKFKECADYQENHIAFTDATQTLYDMLTHHECLHHLTETAKAYEERVRTDEREKVRYNIQKAIDEEDFCQQQRLIRLKL